jgi:phosphatidylglycerol:prolipoprotein diacylglycerol transferase
MRSTLFHIPEKIAGWPLFGFGLLLAAWIAFSLGMIIWIGRRQGWGVATFANLPVYLLVAAGIALIIPRLSEPGYGLPIRSYGLTVLIGVVAGVGLAVRRARRAGIEEDFVFSLAFWLFAAGITGARLFHVIQYWENYRQETPDRALDLFATLLRIINVPAGGLVVYGSLVGGALAMIWYVYRQKLPFLPVADIVAPCLVLGLAFGRIGCLMNGCCFGDPCTYAWAVTFPDDSLPYTRQVERGLLFGIQIGSKQTENPAAENRKGTVPVITWVHPDVALQGLHVGDPIVRFDGLEEPTVEQIRGRLLEMPPPGMIMLVTSAGDRELGLALRSAPARSIPIHPTQVYSSINALLLCLLLLAYYPLRRRDGEVIALLLTLYPISRFILEIIRTDEMAVFGTRFSISQNVSILFLIGVMVLWWYILCQPKDRLWAKGVPVAGKRPAQ